MFNNPGGSEVVLQKILLRLIVIKVCIALGSFFIELCSVKLLSSANIYVVIGSPYKWNRATNPPPNLQNHRIFKALRRATRQASVHIS